MPLTLLLLGDAFTGFLTAAILLAEYLVWLASTYFACLTHRLPREQTACLVMMVGLPVTISAVLFIVFGSALVVIFLRLRARKRTPESCDRESVCNQHKDAAEELVYALRLLQAKHREGLK